MQKITLVAGMAFLAVACGGEKPAADQAPAATPAAAAPAAAPATDWHHLRREDGV